MPGGTEASHDSQIVNLGQPLAQVTADCCGKLRSDGAPDLGAVEYGGLGICDTTRPGGGGGVTALLRDGFKSGGVGAWTAGP